MPTAVDSCTLRNHQAQTNVHPSAPRYSPNNFTPPNFGGTSPQRKPTSKGHLDRGLRVTKQADRSAQALNFQRAISIILAFAIAFAPAAALAAPTSKPTTQSAHSAQTNTLNTCPCAPSTQQQNQQHQPPTHNLTQTNCPLCTPISQPAQPTTSQKKPTPCKGDLDRWCVCGDDCACAQLNQSPPPRTPHNNPAPTPQPRTNIAAIFPITLFTTINIPSPSKVTRSTTLPADSRANIPPIGLNARPQAAACTWLT